MTHKSRTPGPSATVAAEAERLSVKVGRLAPGSGPGALLVDYEGNISGPLPARSVVPLDDATIRQALSSRRPAVLLFEDGDPRQPIVVGLVAADGGAALFEALLAPPRAESRATPTEARVDGKRVVLEGQDEVVLKCGDASITLTRDGKVFLRGAYVETRSTGVNRIKGGSVKIN